MQTQDETRIHPALRGAMNTMEFDDIGRVWRDEATGRLRRTRTEDLSTALGRATRYNSHVRRRLDLTSKLVAVPVAILFVPRLRDFVYSSSSAARRCGSAASS